MNWFDHHQTMRHHLLQYYIPCFTANLLYRAACFANFDGILGFCVPSVIWVVGGGGGGCKSQRNAFAHASFALKNETENGSRLIDNSEGNLDGEWNFCRGEGDRLSFILASKVDICKKDQKHVRAKLVNYCPQQDDHRQWTLKHRNKQNGSKSTDHRSQTMTFWTRSKYTSVS